MPDNKFHALIYGPYRDTSEEAEEDWDRMVEVLRVHAPDLLGHIPGPHEVHVANGRPVPGGAAIRQLSRG